MSTSGSAPPPFPKCMLPSGSPHKLLHPSSRCSKVQMSLVQANQSSRCPTQTVYRLLYRIFIPRRLIRAANVTAFTNLSLFCYSKTIDCNSMHNFSFKHQLLISHSIYCSQAPWAPSSQRGNNGSFCSYTHHLAFVFSMCTYLLYVIILFLTASEGSRKGGDFLSSLIIPYERHYVSKRHTAYSPGLLITVTYTHSLWVNNCALCYTCVIPADVSFLFSYKRGFE